LGIRYGVVILCISSVLVLLLGMVPLPAHANTFIIDNFENDDGSETCDIALTTGSAGAVQTGIAGVIDLIRECMLTIDLENPPAQGEILVNQGAGEFRMMTGFGVETTVMLIYDGEALPANGRSLGLDLSNSDNLRIVYSAADFQVDVTARLVDSDGDSADLTGILVAGTFSTRELNFPLVNFAAQNANLDLNDIDEIKITFETTRDATDYSIDLIDITTLMAPDSDVDGISDEVEDLLVGPTEDLVPTLQGGVSEISSSVDSQTGEITIEAQDASNDSLFEITLPPGTQVVGNSITLDTAMEGSTTAAEVTGLLPPYPPGKTITLPVSTLATQVCIIDDSTKVIVGPLPSCTTTDTSMSQVLLSCDGIKQTFMGFPEAPLSRDYTCTKTVVGADTFFVVDGLAFSFVSSTSAGPPGGGVAVGGDMIQMETTSVLAAGAQYTAAWMIPVIVSAIGIGIVIARKF